MKVNIKDRKHRDLGDLTVNPNMSVKDLKELYAKEAKVKKMDVNRQWFTHNDAKGAAFKENSKTLKDYGVQDGDTLYLKDLGPQISWKLVFLVEYFGPIAIFMIFYYFRNYIYGGATNVPFTFTQKAGFFMVIGHYLKREFETLFIHRFSLATMPIKNLFINCSHYWVIFGVLVGYFLFHPKYTEPTYLSQNVRYVLIGLFIIFELMNFLCHNVLKNLRKPGSTERGIPKGFGFGFVSCANYFWETMCWLSYAVLSGCTTSYLFLLFSFYQMTVWAFQKHRRYKKEFKDYPKNRKAIIPFLL